MSRSNIFASWCCNVQILNFQHLHFFIYQGSIWHFPTNSKSRFRLIDWCCFWSSIRSSIVALLEALFACNWDVCDFRQRRHPQFWILILKWLDSQLSTVAMRGTKFVGPLVRLLLHAVDVGGPCACRASITGHYWNQWVVTTGPLPTYLQWRTC